MKKPAKKLINWISKVFSENGSPSSKRVFGGLIITVLAYCDIYLVRNYEINELIKSLFEVEFIGSCGLLGLTSITNIWNKSNNGDNPNNENDE